MCWQGLWWPFLICTTVQGFLNRVCEDKISSVAPQAGDFGEISALPLWVIPNEANTSFKRFQLFESAAFIVRATSHQKNYDLMKFNQSKITFIVRCQKEWRSLSSNDFCLMQKKKKKKNESIVASQKVHTFTLGKLLATGMCQTDAVIRAKIKGKTT